jgi:hypothetical protein
MIICNSGKQKMRGFFRTFSYCNKFAWSFSVPPCKFRETASKLGHGHILPIISIFICHILGVWIWWSNLLGLDTTCYNNSQIAIFDLTLSTSDHNTLIHSSWARATHCYVASGLTSQKTHPLPSNGCRLLLRIRCRGMCLLSRYRKI